MMQPGEQINGKYRLIRMIGDGGMGSVYEALHEVLGTPVALKFLHADLASKPNVASRFLREARVSATIKSTYVTRVTDVETTPDGIPFLVMELLSGESLQAFIERRGRIPVAESVGIMAQVLLGIEAAHACGVVHRDLKPENIFLCSGDSGYEIKLLDFGVAKVRETSSVVLDEKGLTRPGSLMGTPEYMAPEQMFTAERVDHRADLFSAGVILYEMISGRRPADGDSPQQIISLVAAGRVTSLSELMPELPMALASLVHRAMHAHVEQRFDSAAAMRQALAAFSEGVSFPGRQALDAPASAVAPALVKGVSPFVGAAALDATARSADNEAANAPVPAERISAEAQVRASDPAQRPVRTAAAPAFGQGGAQAPQSPDAGRRGASGRTAALAEAQRPDAPGARYGSAPSPAQQAQQPRPQPQPSPQANATAMAPWQQPAGYARPPSPVAHYGAVGSPHYSYPMARAGGGNTATRWLVAGLLAFGAGLVVTLVLLIQGSRSTADDMPPMPQLLDEGVGEPAPVTIAPQAFMPESTPLPVPEPAATTVKDAGASAQPTATSTSKPPAKDAGADAGNTTVIVIPTPWPLPTGIPTLFPLPTWPPPKSN